jgi:Tfp pilus assembly protein PilV
VRRGGEDRQRVQCADPGFSLIEQTIAIVVVMIVLLGLLGTLGAAAKGVVTGRQRTIAVSLGKQTIENMQGAKFSDVASGTGVTTDPLLISGKFETETLVIASPAVVSYQTFPVAVGTTFSMRTFVTAVATTGYRRVTVIIDWPSPSPTHTLRLSSFVFPLVNTSYPASDGLAEVIAGQITLSGCLGSDTFDDVSVALPSARADTSASTLRSSIGGAAGAGSNIAVHVRPDPATCTLGDGTDVRECTRTTVDGVADNDSTSVIGNLSTPAAKTYTACSLTTSGGMTVLSGAGAGATAIVTHDKTDSCTCSFAGTSDAVPWADASAVTTAGTSASFVSGGLTGNLWVLGNVWSSTASVDHDTTGGGIVKATAALAAPAVSVFQIPSGSPAGFDGAVKVNAFTASASAASGYTTVAPTIPGATTAVQLWNGTGYTVVNWVPGTALDQTVSSTFVVGTKQVLLTSRVQAKLSTITTVATAPRTEALANHPSILIVTVAVTITSTIPVPPTTTTVAGPTTTVAAVPAAMDAFTIVVDYGQVLAHGTFLAQAA